MPDYIKEAYYGACKFAKRTEEDDYDYVKLFL